MMTDLLFRDFLPTSASLDHILYFKYGVKFIFIICDLIFEKIAIGWYIMFGIALEVGQTAMFFQRVAGVIFQALLFRGRWWVWD